MELAKLNAVIELAKENFGDGLVSTDIWGKDGQVLVGHQVNEAAAAMLNQVTGSIRNSLETSNYPQLRWYYFLELKDNKGVFVMLSGGDYQMGIAIDMVKCPMGMAVSVAGPAVYKAFVEAVK